MGQVTVQGSELGNALTEMLMAPEITPGDGVYYVYALFRPDGRPCYVGKGRGRRWLQHERMPNHYNRHLASIIKQAGGKLPKAKIVEGLTSDQACEIEMRMISALGREPTGPLVNLTDGGEGSSGYRHRNETRAIMSQKSKGRPKSPEHSKAISDAVASYFAGLDDEGREVRNRLISETTKDAMARPTVRRKISVAMRGKKPSIKHRQANSEGLKVAHANNPEWAKKAVAAMNQSSKFSGRHHTEETKQKMRMAHQARKEASLYGPN